MVMEEGSPQVTLLRESLEKKISGFLRLCKDIPVHQDKCKLLATCLEVLLPSLEEIKKSPSLISARAHENFEGLTAALTRAEKVVKKIKSTSKFKRVFLNRQLSVDLSQVTGDILDRITALRFKTSLEQDEEIRQLKGRLEELKDLTDTGPSKDFVAEVKEVLVARTTGEATTSTGGGRVMDDLLQLLAGRFDSDVETVRKEWQELKDEITLLREEIEYTTEDKGRMEEDFLRQLTVYFDRGEQEQTTQSHVNGSDSTQSQVDGSNSTESHVDASDSTQSHVDASNSTSETSPAEFKCGICFEVFEDPVVCASGHTFCRKCITTWYNSKPPGNRICPITRILVPDEILIENITLRSLITMWKDASLRNLPFLDNVEVPVDDLTGSPEFSPQPVDPAPSSTTSDGRRESSSLRSMQSRTPIVDRLISSLSSNRSPIEIRTTLKQLVSIAERSSGQREIHSAGGVPAVARLLDSDNHSIVEKAANVLDAITFEVKGENCEHLSYEDREMIWTSVAQHALKSLIKLLDTGNQNTRLTAAQTLLNLLADEEIREEVRQQSGVVTGFFGLTSISSGLLFPNGKSLCIKGLALLRGEKSLSRSSSESDLALTTALIGLARSLGATPKLVEETLEALSSVLYEAGSNIRGSLLQKSDILFLIRLYRPPRSHYVRRSPSFSQSSVLSEVGVEVLLNILDDLSLAAGLPQVLLECGLSTYLLPRIADPEARVHFVKQGIKVLWRCMSSSSEDFSPTYFQIDWQMEMKGVVRILAQDQIPLNSKLEMLSVLVHLCKGQDVDPLRESFLNTGGVAALEVLAESPLLDIKEEVALMFRLLAEFHPSREELRTGETTKLLMNLLDDSPKCRCEAVVAVASIPITDDWVLSTEEGRFKQFVDLLRPTYPSECREAATIVLAKASQKLVGAVSNSDLVNVLREQTTIDLLVDIVRDNLRVEAKLKAAELVINVAVQDHTICSSIEGEEGGLSVLKKFGDEVGVGFRVKVVQLLNAFSKESDVSRDCVMKVGGIPLLMDALGNGRNKEEVFIASTALRSLVTYGPARKFAVEARLVEKAIGCISVRACNRQLIEIIDLILDRSTAESIRKAKGVQALVMVLTLRAPSIEEKRRAVSVLAKLIKLDKRTQPILRQENGIKVLNDFLTIQAREAIPSFYFGDGMEALQALTAATEDDNNLIPLSTEQCIQPLLSILSRDSLPQRDEELVLTLLYKLSRSALNSGSSTPNFTVEPLSKQLLRVVDTASSSTSSSIELAIRIIRNISLFGPGDRVHMLNEGEGVVKVLLERVCGSNTYTPSDDVNHAVFALERFMLEDHGRVSFIRNGGIPLMIKILKGKAPDQTKGFAARILVMVASVERTADVCTAIWECKSDFLLALSDILERENESIIDCKCQLAVLLKFLIQSGPTGEVCKSLTETGCTIKLTDLKSCGDRNCEASATQALEAFNKYHKDNRNPFSLFRLPKSSHY